MPSGDDNQSSIREFGSTTSSLCAAGSTFDFNGRSWPDGVTYDGAGNLIGTTSGDAYTYNPWGNLTEATVDGTTTTASFDATGTRVQVDGIDQLWDRTGYGTLISTGGGDSYLHNPTGGILRDGNSWLHTDAVGSVRHVTDPAGTVTASSAFTVFGEPRSTGTSGFGFAGEQTDPNSLVHLRARAYNPALGSFMAYDPTQPGGPSTAGWNHYSYSANNPTTWTDPTGQAVMMEYAERMVQGMIMGMMIGMWVCQEGDFDWKAHSATTPSTVTVSPGPSCLEAYSEPSRQEPCSEPV